MSEKQSQILLQLIDKAIKAHTNPLQKHLLEVQEELDVTRHALDIVLQCMHEIREIIEESDDDESYAVN